MSDNQLVIGNHSVALGTMKLAYVRPSAELIEIEVDSMLAISIKVEGDEEPDEELSRGRRGSWGNLWED
ncbi:MAG: hypothetical protein E7091_04095 [Bacteroidales bacterium]|nr:hypothetical protein [Bacteroidales bacterium]